jgi:hypothetical protein
VNVKVLEIRKEILMAKSKKSNRGSWKKERASVISKGKAQPRSNKGRAGSDESKRPEAGSTSQYWRAGYTRKDGTQVKGHYVKNPNQK